MTRDGPHQWPTGAATRKYVDRATDRLNNRCDKQTDRIRGLQAELVLVNQRLHALLLEVRGIDDQQG